MILKNIFGKIFGGHSNLLYNVIISNGEAPEPPPPIIYEYPTFNINSDGDLIATYLTNNRNLSFSISDGDLFAIYTSEDPKLSIVNNDLIREV